MKSDSQRVNFELTRGFFALGHQYEWKLERSLQMDKQLW